MKNLEFRYTFFDDNDKKLDWISNIDYPFLQPFKILIKQGRPVGKTIYLVLVHQNEFYAFGTLNYTKGERFIFFPGIKDTNFTDNLSGVKGILDHITCERNKKSFHIKLRNKSRKVPKFPITEIYPDHFYWFSLALGDPNYLQKLKNLRYIFSAPKSDSTRRLNELMFCFQDLIHHIISPPENKLFDDEFLNFNFFISKDKVFNQKNIKIISPIKVLPRKSIGKIYELDLLETDFKIVINLSRLRYRSILEKDMARIYHN